MNRGLQDRFHPSTPARTRLAATALAASLALAACGADEPAASGQSSKPAGTAASASPSGTATDTTSTTDTPSPSTPSEPIRTPEALPPTTLKAGEAVSVFPPDADGLAILKAAGIDQGCMVTGSSDCDPVSDYLVDATGTTRIVSVDLTEPGDWESIGVAAISVKGLRITSAKLWGWEKGSGNGGQLVCAQTPVNVCLFELGRDKGKRIEVYKVSADASLTKVRIIGPRLNGLTSFFPAPGGVAVSEGIPRGTKSVTYRVSLITPTSRKLLGCKKITSNNARDLLFGSPTSVKELKPC